VCSLIAGETCPKGCSLAMAVVLSPVYTAVTWQWVHMHNTYIYIYWYNVTGSWSLLATNCTRYSTEDAVRIGNSFIIIPITRHYNHSQLSITLLRVYTIIILIRSWLQSLIPLLHWLTSQLSITVSNYHTLSRTQSLHFTLRTSRRDLTPRFNSFLNTDFFTVTPGTAS
jgi:hypothetical protein